MQERRTCQPTLDHGAIQTLRAAGFTYERIAKALNCTPQAASYAARRSVAAQQLASAQTAV